MSRELRVLAGAALAVLLVGGAYLAGLFPPGLLPELAKRTASMMEPGFNYGPRGPLVSKLRYELEQTPCDRTRAAQYAQTVFAAGDRRGSIQFTDDFIARCGKFPQLRSISYSAHMRLGEFDLAIRDAKELIDSAPRNAGYWVWRSMAYRARGLAAPALSDLEQAFRVQPEQLTVARQLISAYEELGRGCDARLVMQEHQMANPASSGLPEVKQWLAYMETLRCEPEPGTSK
jgi:aspartyl protease family protein